MNQTDTVGRITDLDTSGIVLPYMPLKMRIIADNPKQFSKAHDSDAGYDILASDRYSILPGEKAVINTGLFIELPQNYVGIVKSRSGLSVKHDLEVGAGVVDAGYRGEVKVVLRNMHPKNIYIINEGDKVAQMLVVKLPNIHIERVDSLSDSDRGSAGFNSTGY